MRAIWILPIIGAIFGAFILLITIASDGAAPAQAAGFAAACALAVVPYVFARAVIGLADSTRTQSTDRIVAAIDAGNFKPASPSPAAVTPTSDHRLFTPER